MKSSSKPSRQPQISSKNNKTTPNTTGDTSGEKMAVLPNLNISLNVSQNTNNSYYLQNNEPQIDELSSSLRHLKNKSLTREKEKVMKIKQIKEKETGKHQQTFVPSHFEYKNGGREETLGLDTGTPLEYETCSSALVREEGFGGRGGVQNVQKTEISRNKRSISCVPGFSHKAISQTQGSDNSRGDLGSELAGTTEGETYTSMSQSIPNDQNSSQLSVTQQLSSTSPLDFHNRLNDRSSRNNNMYKRRATATTRGGSNLSNLSNLVQNPGSDSMSSRKSNSHSPKVPKRLHIQRKYNPRSIYENPCFQQTGGVRKVVRVNPPNTEQFLNTSASNISTNKLSSSRESNLGRKLQYLEKRNKELQTLLEQFGRLNEQLTLKLEASDRERDKTRKDYQDLARKYIEHSKNDLTNLLEEYVVSKFFIMAEEVENADETISNLSKEVIRFKSKTYELHKKYATICREKDRMTIKNELEISHQKMKNKLLEETLTKRNLDYEGLEKKNKQMIYLLEKYDKKVTELQEENKIKELKVKEFEKEDPSLVSTDDMEGRIKFLIDLLKKYSLQKKDSPSALKETDLESLDKQRQIVYKEEDKIKFNKALYIDEMFPRQLKSYYASSEF